MQVFELADDLKVDSHALVTLLRQMGIPVSDEDATISDGDVAKVVAKAGGGDSDRFLAAQRIGAKQTDRFDPPSGFHS